MKTYKNATEEKIVHLILNGAAVALFQGRAETGPRALGNRSILWDPQLTYGRTYINRIKKRESWRPFAGTILEESASYWFDMKGMKSSPYMSYAVKLKDKNNSWMFQSILHQDNTCRIQTLTQEQNPILYSLIKSCNNTYIIPYPPVLGNTSFNAAGDPLVHTIDDAIETMEKTPLEYLWLPETEELLCSPNV